MRKTNKLLLIISMTTILVWIVTKFVTTNIALSDMIMMGGRWVNPDRNHTKEHFLFVVMILSHRSSDRVDSRAGWNNLTFWNSKNVSTRILYVVGNDQEQTAEQNPEQNAEQDVIVADLVECRCNLRHKIQTGFQYIRDHYSFDYILKTDIDVFNNYKAWTDAILRYNNQVTGDQKRSSSKELTQSNNPLPNTTTNHQKVLYGGSACNRHIGVPYRFCSGMGYLVHSSLIDHVIRYPLSRMEGAEDRTVGKCMSEVGVSPVNLLSGSVNVGLRKETCRGLGGLMKERGVLHAGKSEKMLACWNSADLSVI